LFRSCSGVLVPPTDLSHNGTDGIRIDVLNEDASFPNIHTNLHIADKGSFYCSNTGAAAKFATAEEISTSYKDIVSNHPAKEYPDSTNHPSRSSVSMASACSLVAMDASSPSR